MMTLIALFLPISIVDAPESNEPIDAKVAFERLLSLEGTWEGSEGGAPYTMTYKTTGAGSTVVETYFPGSPMEMMSMYHLDGDELRMTHYCAAGNQPRMILDRDASTKDVLVFKFDGGSNLDPKVDMHVHEGKITFKDKDHILGEWVGYMEGKAQTPQPFDLTRKE